MRSPISPAPPVPRAIWCGGSFAIPTRGAGWAIRAVRCAASSQFRAVAAKYPHDPAFTELIEDLRENSPEFGSLWAQHDVLGSAEGLKRYLHPELGELILDYTQFDVPGDGDIRLIVLTAAPGSETERKLQLLCPAERLRLVIR
jgi:hypothetical protein